MIENDQTRDRWLDFRRMQVASDQITFLVESSDDITQDSEVFVPVRIVESHRCFRPGMRLWISTPVLG